MIRGKIFHRLRHFQHKALPSERQMTSTGPTSCDSATESTSPDISSTRLRDSPLRGRRREAENKESVGVARAACLLVRRQL